MFDALLKINNSTIFLDIDGTLVADSVSDIEDKKVISFISKLKEKNDLYICSNGNKNRNILISEHFKISITNVNFKKPSYKCIENLEISGNQKIVFGDKYISDGLFAINIGAKFIKADRIISGKEGFYIKISYLFDDIFGKYLYKIFPFIKLIRPNHLVKNLIIFSPLFFAGKFFDTFLLIETLKAFVSFSALASSIYVINDLYDIKKDSLHKIKSLRPLSSGIINKKQAVIFSATLILISLYFAYGIANLYPLLGLYFILNLIYSNFLKKKNVLDIILISFLYVIRIIVGGVVSSVYISPWIILCMFFGALFVTSCKRYSQYNLNRDISYPKELLTFSIYFSSTISICIYSIWSVLEHNNTNLVYSSFLVVFVLLKMVEYVYKSPDKAEFPEVLVFKDKWILSAFFVWFLLVFYIFYLK